MINATTIQIVLFCKIRVVEFIKGLDRRRLWKKKNRKLEIKGWRIKCCQDMQEVEEVATKKLFDQAYEEANIRSE